MAIFDSGAVVDQSLLKRRHGQIGEGVAREQACGGAFTDLPVTSIQQRLINDGATIEN